MILKSFLILITIALIAIFISRVVPVVIISLKIRGIKSELKKFSRTWKRLERRFVNDAGFREDFSSDAGRMSGFFSIVDQISGTDYTRGQDTEALKNQFNSDPLLMQERIKEYLKANLA